jgi:ketosteroid isomerase-like protein
MSARISALVLAVTLANCSAPQATPETTTGEADIRKLLDRWSDAFRRKDVDGVMAIYVPGKELTAFDIIPPLAYRGADSYRRDYSEFFKEFKGPMQVEIRDLRILADRDVAFAYGLERMGGTLADGSRFETWLRFTQGYRRINGRWLAVHDHISVPAEPDSGKARFDLKP